MEKPNKHRKIEQAEEELKAERNKLEAITKAMEWGLTIQDLDYNIIYQNDVIKNKFGSRLGEKCYKIYEGEDKICNGCPVERAIKEGKAQTSERKVMVPAGETIFLENVVYPIRNARGEIISCLEISKDITERKQAASREQIRTRILEAIASPKSLTDILELIVKTIEAEYPEALGSILILDEQGEHLLFGAAPSLPDFYNKAVHGLEIGEAQGSCGTAAYRKQRVVVEDILTHPYWVEARELAQSANLRSCWSEPILSRSNRVLGTFAIYHRQPAAPSEEQVKLIKYVADATALAVERKQSEKALRKSEEKLQRMFDSVGFGIAVNDLNGIISDVNEGLIRMLGYNSKGELLGKSHFELIPQRYHSEIRARMEEGLERESLGQMCNNIARADGSEFPAEISATVLKDASNNPTGFITIIRDVTQRKQAEEREKQLQQELNLAGHLASIGEMASGVAHEINNPLTGVIGFTQLLMNRDIPDDIREDLEVINKEAQRVAEIVSGLLAFAHQHKPGREQIDINQLILEVLKLRSHNMQVDNIQAVTHLAPDLPQTTADGNQLQQVFVNIILNAEKAMIKENGGGQLSIKREQVDDIIRISLADDGPGISKENLDKIFNPFFTTSEAGQGTGLGLSICHGIITQHNGRIYAESELGKGATFIVELPLVADAEKKIKPKVMAKETPKREGVKVLVVDDEKAILAFLNRLLAGWGYEVETVDNANDALDRLRSERYNLILMDIKMPVISGIELYNQLEVKDPSLTQRVMFITGDVMETTTRKFLDRTGVPHIAKPFNIGQLKNSIDSMLAKAI